MAGLSRRQQEIADLAIRGLQNKAIAFQLGVSMSTVKAHLLQIFLKMNVRNRTALAAAFNHGGNYEDRDRRLDSLGGTDC
jgi:DNA-binding NarL/FixJ family response regulator